MDSTKMNYIRKRIVSVGLNDSFELVSLNSKIVCLKFFELNITITIRKIIFSTEFPINPGLCKSNMEKLLKIQKLLKH